MHDRKNTCHQAEWCTNSTLQLVRFPNIQVDRAERLAFSNTIHQVLCIETKFTRTNKTEVNNQDRSILQGQMKRMRTIKSTMISKKQGQPDSPLLATALYGSGLVALYIHVTQVSR